MSNTAARWTLVAALATTLLTATVTSALNSAHETPTHDTTQVTNR